MSDDDTVPLRPIKIGEVTGFWIDEAAVIPDAVWRKLDVSGPRRSPTTGRMLQHDGMWLKASYSDQMQEAASFLALDPRNPLFWPIATLRSLIALRDTEGREAFMKQVCRMLGV